jgi:hypothetical protein
MAVVLPLIGAVVLGVPLLMYLMQDGLIFFPRPMPEAQRLRVAAASPGVASVRLEAPDGTPLHAWHVPAGEGAPLVLYFGGNAEDVSWMIERTRASVPHAAWLLTEYRGYGSSGGRPAETALAADALAWFDHAASALGAREVYVFGRSLGTGVAVHVAAARPVAGVIAVAPFDSLTAVARHYYPFLPVRLLLRHRFDSAARAPRIAAPLLSLVASADEIIPVARSLALYEAWGGEKSWVALEGAGHNSTDDAPIFWASIRRFVAAR